MKQKFSIGKLIASATINESITINDKFAEEIVEALRKYRHCDWGYTYEEDRASNDKAITDGVGRILAIYETCLGKILIITELEISNTSINFLL